MKTSHYLILIGSVLVMINAIGDSLFGASFYIVLPIWVAAAICLLLGIKGTRQHNARPWQRSSQPTTGRILPEFTMFVSLLIGVICASLLIRHSHPQLSSLTIFGISAVTLFVGGSILYWQGARRKRSANGSVNKP